MTAPDEIDLNDINPDEWFNDGNAPEISAYPKADERLDIMNFGGIDARISLKPSQRGMLCDRVEIELPAGKAIKIRRVWSELIDGTFVDNEWVWRYDRDCFDEWLQEIGARIVNMDTGEMIDHSDGE